MNMKKQYKNPQLLAYEYALEETIGTSVDMNDNIVEEGEIPG